MKQKLLEMVQVTALFDTFPPLMVFYFVWSCENGNEFQNRSLGTKLGYKGSRATQFSARARLGTSGPAWSGIWVFIKFQIILKFMFSRMLQELTGCFLYWYRI